MTNALPKPVPDLDNLIHMVPIAQRYGLSEESKNFLACRFMESVRYQDLDRRQQYFDCTQHDWKRYDFDGRMIRPGPQAGQPMLSSIASPSYVPLRQRRPSTPYRLGKTIVDRFSNMVFGEGRWPDILVKGDADTQDYLQALATEASLPVKMAEARDMGGSVGTVGLSWKFWQGKPIVEVHNGKNLHVHRWKDRARLIPEHVTEVYRYLRDVWDADKKQLVREQWWWRRDWTPKADVVFRQCRYMAGQEPIWEVDEEQSVIHDEDETHFIWVVNSATEGIDGQPDYDGLYDKLDTLDVVLSTLQRGTTLNLDPTLKLRMDPEVVGYATLRKGSENALVTGKDGDASYMELGGSSVSAGIQLFNILRSTALETSQCVIPDPDKIAAAGTSSVALKMMFAPMMGRSDKLRDIYGQALHRLLSQMDRSVRRHLVVTEDAPAANTNDDDSQERDRFYIDLPPRVEETEEVGADGEHTGEVSITITPRHPGMGGTLELQWGPYFKPTSTDVQATVGTMVTASGGKAVISRKAAVEVVAGFLSRDPERIWQDMLKDDEAERLKQAAMFGLPGPGDGLPPAPVDVAPQSPDGDGVTLASAGEPASVPGATSAEREGEAPEAPAAIEMNLTATDVATIVTVNEGRKSQGLGPLLHRDGSVDPDGELTIAEFKAKRAAMIATAAAAASGQVLDASNAQVR